MAGRGAKRRLTAQGEAVVKAKRVGSRHSRWIPRSRRARLVIAIVALVAIGLTYYLSGHLSVDQGVELSVRADQGMAAVKIASEPYGVSPGCGCQNPRYGKLNWTGLALPSWRFRLGVSAQPSPGIPKGLWQMTAMAPDIDKIDWYASPYAILEVQVVASRNGRAVTLFSGPTTFLDVAGTQPIYIEQDKRFPYAALLPGFGGETTVTSTSAVRPGHGGSLFVDSEVGSHEEAKIGREGITKPEPELTQRGPMIDIIGRSTFRLPKLAKSVVYVGKKQVTGLRPNDRVTIRVHTPYSLRLFASPARKRWADELPTIWRQEMDAAEEAPAQVRRELRRGPTLTGRYVITEPLPSYSLQMSHLAVPGQPLWSSFARRSARKDRVKRMTKPNPDEPIIYTEYGLPPVSPQPEVGVFGKVTQFTSSAVRGEVVTNSHSSRLRLGDTVKLESDDGVDAGKYRFTPLISAGLPTEEATVAGHGQVWVNDRPRTTLSWLVWIAGVLGAALIGLVLAGVFRLEPRS